MNIFLVAAEPSGDALGADLIETLRVQGGEGVTISGIGGSAMASKGVSSDFDTTPLSIVGFIDGIKAYGTVVKLADEATERILAAKPDVVVLIDSWGFMLRVAQRVRKAAPHIRLVKYVGPQVWATRPGRAKTLAAHVDELLCIHEFEVPFYEPHGLPVTVVGNPALSRTTVGDGPAFRDRYGLAADEPLALILPGSRRSEVQRVAPTLLEAGKRLRERLPNVKLAMVLAPSIRDAMLETKDTWPEGLIVSDDPEEKFDAMAAADVGLVCSGTVTTEAALQGLAMVIGYRLGPVTWFLARHFLYKAPHVTLFNMAAGREIARELLQADFTPEAVADETEALLLDDALRYQQVADQYSALNAMGRDKRPAAQLAADVILGDA